MDILNSIFKCASVVIIRDSKAGWTDETGRYWARFCVETDPFGLSAVRCYNDNLEEALFETLATLREQYGNGK
jgi:hypothetical protein